MRNRAILCDIDLDFIKERLETHFIDSDIVDLYESTFTELCGDILVEHFSKIVDKANELWKTENEFSEEA